MSGALQKPDQIGRSKIGSIRLSLVDEKLEAFRVRRQE